MLLGSLGEHYLILFRASPLKLRTSPFGSDECSGKRRPAYTWEALKSGDFVVAKSEFPFTALFTDQALEQEISWRNRWTL